MHAIAVAISSTCFLCFAVRVLPRLSARHDFDLPASTLIFWLSLRSHHALTAVTRPLVVSAIRLHHTQRRQILQHVLRDGYTRSRNSAHQVSGNTLREFAVAARGIAITNIVYSRLSPFFLALHARDCGRT